MHLQSQALSIVMTLCAVSGLLPMPLQKLVNKDGGRTPKVDIERKPRGQSVDWFNTEMLGLLHHFKDGKIRALL